MKFPFFWVDAFTSQVFAGNPAGAWASGVLGSEQRIPRRADGSDEDQADQPFHQFGQVAPVRAGRRVDGGSPEYSGRTLAGSGARPKSQPVHR